MSTVTPPYTLDNGWTQARRRLDLLEACYDAGSVRRLGEAGVGPGWRCLEVGGGGGSITRWLCSAVGAGGRVTAVDIDTRFLNEIDASNLDVLCLDVTTAELPREAFDLVHTRALLIHLPDRDRVLDALVGCLRPGGRLLVEEPDQHDVEAPGRDLYRDTWAALVERLRVAGVDVAWPTTLPGLLHERGLVDVEADSEMHFFEGGSLESEFLRLTIGQLREAGLTSGIPARQLDDLDSLLQQPGAWYPGFAMIGARGRKPETP